jgi:hypothetical protein
MPRRQLPVLLVPLLGLGLAACATTPPVPLASPTPSASPSSSVSPTPSVTTATPTVSATPTSTSTGDTSGLVLRGDGLGVYSFGAKQIDVTPVLEKQLGEPDESSQSVQCPLDEKSPWAQTVSWGAFWVEYDAKDSSKKSPRTLAAWGFNVNAELRDGMSMQDGVPLNLTFAQLKAKYPSGKTEDLGLGDGSKRFILPNKIFFVGSGSRPDAVQAGAFSTCE